ncbi:hypothetical protein ES705_46823 [subsurface metagenome]
MRRINMRTLDEALDEVDQGKAKMKLPEETLVKLEGMGFTEKEGKIGLFSKKIDDVNFFWDFRKAKDGAAYASRINPEGEGFEDVPRQELEQMEEYLTLRPEKRADAEKKKTKEKVVKKPEEKTKALVPASDKKAEGLLRGSERDLIRLMDVRIQLDSIIDASADKEKLGEGLLWHVEPSAELVDMIAQGMGGVSVKIVEFDTNILEDPNSMKKYATYYCVVEAKDEITGTTGLGAAEQIIDFEEIEKQQRTFARTLVIRKASRNAVERLIPIPRKAMVFLIRKKLEEHNKEKK